MKIFLLIVLTGSFLLNACGNLTEDSRHDHDNHAHANITGIESHDSWVNVASKDDDTDLFMILHNHSDEDDFLVGASTIAAKSVGLYLYQADANTPLVIQETIALPPKRMVELVPGGYHLKLISLTQDIKVGDMIVLTLHFRINEDLLLSIPVKDW